MNIRYIKILIIVLKLATLSSVVSSITVTKSLNNVLNNNPAEYMEINISDARYSLAEQYVELNYELDPYMKEWEISIEGYLKNIKPKYKDNNFTIPLSWKAFNILPETVITGNANWYPANDDNKLLKGTSYYALLNNKQAETPLYIYFQADFLNTVEGEYAGEVLLKITDLTDRTAPVIIHIPIAKIGVVGNLIKIEAIITDDRNIVSADLYYRIDDLAWNKKSMTISGISSVSDKTGIKIKAYTVISPAEIFGHFQVAYYIETSDGYNKMTWNNRTALDPQIISISRVTKFKKRDKGMLIVEDGNPDDGETSLNIPQGALDEEEEITIIQIDIDDIDIPEGSGLTASKKPLAVYQFEPSGLQFKKPVDLTLLYFDLDNDGKIDANIGHASGESSDISENEIGVFWWDGFDWRLVGKSVDSENNTVKGQITHFSLYAVFPVKPMTAGDYRPKEKIITPALQDNINDTAFFEGLITDYEIKIFDITGRPVREIDASDSIGANWDGKDENGNIVESGVYIYQFKGEVEGKMKVISGTIVVAK